MRKGVATTAFSLISLLILAVTSLLLGFKVVIAADKPLIYIHDGAIDEYVAYLLLESMDQYHVEGIILVAADCIDRPAISAQCKLQQYIGKTETPVTLSRACGRNPFPWDYRQQCIEIDGLPSLKNIKPWIAKAPFPNGEDFLRKTLRQAVKNKRPVTLLVNCPMTPLYLVLSKNPKLEEGIERLVWMGGSINIKGNLYPSVLPKGLFGERAEWNAFWDPSGVAWIFENTSFPIIEFPLNVTNHAPITEEFMLQLNKVVNSSPYAKIAWESYRLITSLSKENQATYEMWDVVTTSYLGRPDLYEKPKVMKLKIITEGKNQGTVVEDPNGRQVHVVLKMKNQQFYYDYVLKQLAEAK